MIRNVLELRAPVQLINDVDLPEMKVEEKEEKDGEEDPGQPVHSSFINGAQTSIDHPTKINQLMVDLKALRSRNDGSKAVVFSQFRDTMAAIAHQLEEEGIVYASVDGTSSPAARKVALNRFNFDPEVTVFLLSIRVGSVGITLTAANYMFIMDHSMNRAPANVSY